MTLKLKVHSGPATGPADFGLWSGCERVPPGTQVGSDGTRCIIGCLAIRFKSSCPISALKQPFYVFYDGKKLRVAISIYGLALKIFWILKKCSIYNDFHSHFLSSVVYCEFDALIRAETDEFRKFYIFLIRMINKCLPSMLNIFACKFRWAGWGESRELNFGSKILSNIILTSK